MLDDRPQADRILVAHLTGEARHRARWGELSGDEEAAAVAELRELAVGRADLLAEVAGIFEGTSEGEPDEPLARRAAWLCRKAGADPGGDPGVSGRGTAPKGRREAAPAVRRSARRRRSTAARVPGWRRHVIMRRAVPAAEPESGDGEAYADIHG
jgi:hypothetical protein